MGPQVLVLADDMTGALEVGAAFAAAGVDAAVTTAHDPGVAALDAGVHALVVDTETRHVDAPRAREPVFRLAAEARRRGVRYLLKKTDSTLRGNVAAEVMAAGAAWEGAPVFYIPAYPKLGRTVSGGVLRVEGRPVSETVFGVDRWNPVRESHIPTLLRTAGVPLPVVEVAPPQLEDARGAAFFVVDGATEQDVRECAQSLSRRAGPFVMAGPAGLAHHFAELAGLPRARPPKIHPAHRCLVVSGSLHPVSGEQIARALSCGLPALDPTAVPETVRRVGWAVLRNPESECSDGLEHARDLGKSVAAIIGESDLDAAVIFGGDTAFGVIMALGDPLLRCLGEIEPGVPATAVKACDLRRIFPGRERDLLLLTKAGGFGPPDVIARLRQKLTTA